MRQMITKESLKKIDEIEEEKQRVERKQKQMKSLKNSCVKWVAMCMPKWKMTILY